MSLLSRLMTIFSFISKIVTVIAALMIIFNVNATHEQNQNNSFVDSKTILFALSFVYVTTKINDLQKMIIILHKNIDELSNNLLK